jgi:hypothetical protein
MSEVAMTVPIIRDPVSPIMIFVGGAPHHSKARHAPLPAAAMVATPRASAAPYMSS